MSILSSGGRAEVYAPQASRPQALPKAKRLEYLKAAAENDLGPIREMLKAGHWLDEVRNDERQNPLHVAALEGSEEVVATLLRCQRVARRLDARDCAHRTPLHVAAAMGFPGIVDRLVNAGASLDLQDEKGNTAVSLAVLFEWSEPLRLLLEASADPLLENYQGLHAVDIANERRDVECAAILAELAAHDHDRQLRSATGLDSLRRCFLPQWRPKPPPIPADVLADHALKQQGRKEAAAETLGAGRPTLAAVAEDRSTKDGPTSPGPREAAQEAVNQASLEIGEKARRDDDSVIEWNGLDPKLVKKAEPVFGGGADAPMPAAEADKPAWRRKLPDAPGAAPSAAKPPLQEQAPVKPTSPTSSLPPAPSPEDLKSYASRALGSEAPAPASAPASASPASPREAVEYAIFRLQPFFDERVKRLEFEVEWKDEKVAVGVVKPGGEADRRGLVQRDRIISIGGVSTFGKGRDELLPLLKQRPLQLKVDREARVQDADHEPHLELTLPFGDATADFEELGLDVEWRGQLPVAAAVKPYSKAWAAGVMEGDALYTVGDWKTTSIGKDELVPALQEKLPGVSAWRRPLGLDLMSEWVLKGPRRP